MTTHSNVHVFSPADAPAAKAAPTPRPAATRLLQGDGANIIMFNFAPGQVLKEHKSAHPITVQCIQGELMFTVEEQTIPMTPGTVLHLRALVPHQVDCPSNASEQTNVLLLTMLTGERHQ